MDVRIVSRSQNRLPDRASIVERDDVACAWCGFHCVVGHHAYLEEDGRTRFACDVCFNARHAADADPAMFRLAWLPEVGQEDLAHLTRVMGLLLRRLPRSPRGSVEGVDKLSREHVLAAFRSLKARSGDLDSVFKENMGGNLMETWSRLGEAHKAALLSGLRLLPLAFPESHVDAWANDESSLNGYGANLLDENDWFLAEIGLGDRAPEARRPKTSGGSGR